MTMDIHQRLAEIKRHEHMDKLVASLERAYNEGVSASRHAANPYPHSTPHFIEWQHGQFDRRRGEAAYDGESDEWPVSAYMTIVFLVVAFVIVTVLALSKPGVFRYDGNPSQTERHGLSTGSAPKL